ncbi:hypothetical protein [Streptomyces sp. MspMP-M5]|nr:hypothetical protein [Streptomyces sp. MspMP-M5]
MAAAAAPAVAHGQASDRARSARRIVLTNSDGGRAVTVTSGDDIEVRLTGNRANGLTYSWSRPTSSEPTVLERVSGGTTPSGSATAVFHAEHGGTATITAQRRCHADRGHYCPLVVTPWKAKVKVEVK